MRISRQQFWVLYRTFTARLIDLEVLSEHGDAQRLFGQLAALLSAFSFVLALYMVPRYPLSGLSGAQLAVVGIGDQELLFSTTMAVVGMFGVMAWTNVLPGRRDALILGSLPVSTQTIFVAKIAALASGLGVSILAVNVFTGVGYPLVFFGTGASRAGFGTTFAAYWLVLLVSGFWVFLTILGLQGLAVCFLPHRPYLKVSNLLQIVVFFIVLGAYFLTPGPAELPLSAPENRHIARWLPSFWFVGLFQILTGSTNTAFTDLAQRALVALVTSGTIAAATFSFSYFRGMRRVIEQADIVSADRTGWLSHLVARLSAVLFTKPLDRAIVLFTARTLARSSQHRLILSIYSGLAIAISLAYTKSLLFKTSAAYTKTAQQLSIPEWYEPNRPFLVAGFVMLFFGLIGTRAVFALPATLKANWVFRITAIQRPPAYFAAVRKTLYALTAGPIWIASAVFYLTIWPTGPAVLHVAFLLLLAVIIVERSLRTFRKIPFTCSYLPGRADLTRRLGAYGALFLFLIDIGTRIELDALHKRAAALILLSIVLALAVRARRLWAAQAALPGEQVQFEERGVADVSPLDLRQDGIWSLMDAEAPEANEPQLPRPRRAAQALLRFGLVFTALCAAGAIYEQVAGRRQRSGIAQVGTSYDIGGRSLNLSCLGQGTPVVVFENGGAGVGYAWVAMQRAVAQYTTACWYDRAGAGWSDPAPCPRDSLASAADLHALLNAAHVAPPYVLVGASLGGFIVRVYAGLHPQDVAGMVLVDSSHIDERLPIPPPEAWNFPPFFYRARSVLVHALWRTGVLRAIYTTDERPSRPKDTTPQDWRVLDSLGTRSLAEFSKIPIYESAKQARAAKPMGDRPLIVLTAGLPDAKAENPVEARRNIAWQKRWIEQQAQLTHFSDRGIQLVVDNSRHCIQCDAPDAILGAVNSIVEVVRAAPAFSVSNARPAAIR